MFYACTTHRYPRPNGIMMWVIQMVPFDRDAPNALVSNLCASVFHHKTMLVVLFPSLPLLPPPVSYRYCEAKGATYPTLCCWEFPLFFVISIKKTNVTGISTFQHPCVNSKQLIDLGSIFETYSQPRGILDKRRKVFPTFPAVKDGNSTRVNYLQLADLIREEWPLVRRQEGKLSERTSVSLVSCGRETAGQWSTPAGNQRLTLPGSCGRSCRRLN